MLLNKFTNRVTFSMNVNHCYGIAKNVETAVATLFLVTMPFVFIYYNKHLISHARLIIIVIILCYCNKTTDVSKIVTPIAIITTFYLYEGCPENTRTQYILELILLIIWTCSYLCTKEPLSNSHKNFQTKM